MDEIVYQKTTDWNTVEIDIKHLLAFQAKPEHVSRPDSDSNSYQWKLFSGPVKHHSNYTNNIPPPPSTTYTSIVLPSRVDRYILFTLGLQFYSSTVLQLCTVEI